jgi:hypothetical protein
MREGGNTGRGVGIADPAVSSEFKNIFKDLKILAFDECKQIVVKDSL